MIDNDNQMQYDENKNIINEFIKYCEDKKISLAYGVGRYFDSVEDRFHFDYPEAGCSMDEYAMNHEFVAYKYKSEMPYVSFNNEQNFDENFIKYILSSDFVLSKDVIQTVTKNYEQISIGIYRKNDNNITEQMFKEIQYEFFAKLVAVLQKYDSKTQYESKKFELIKIFNGKDLKKYNIRFDGDDVNSINIHEGQRVDIPNMEVYEYEQTHYKTNKSSIALANNLHLTIDEILNTLNK